ncbi:hypothetical protein LSTR_LSTR005298 [Laodelphax striatellus]|uniref:Kinesin-like protein KIF13A n=1 Tax=Laodelphax striatellus TaxID=195883 RepID=A0A482X821_LAOST|nr:hypothetical protein LSTR_LSTR005298 [Laodelphax striatellus]
MACDKIKVAVRVRPFSRRELEMGTQCVLEMDGQQTILSHPATIEKMERKPPKTFAFDHCFNSVDPKNPKFASQDVVFDCLGRDILDNAFQGYNACIFAYGQTGSGKSYTMMGNQDKGIIPRLCDSLFDLIAKKQSRELSYKVEVSYMEIYNEKVHDLLDPKASKTTLKVREHNVLGPYVDGLSQLAVTSFQDIDELMAEGNKSRTVAATNMNSESSRSHAVFSILLTQTLTDEQSGVSGEKVSRVSLVDLAGSERAVKTGAVGERLKEGSNINKSLTTLGLVISKLADQSSTNRSKDKFVPYRDSVLTWLLKDNLGGNSKTVMVATLSPAADNYEETLSTLRYADRAKKIVNHAVINEDPNARIIRELRQEVEALKEMLKHATGSTGSTPVTFMGSQLMQRQDIHEKLSESEKLMQKMSQTWEEKLEKTERLQHERQEALENMGISVQASGIKVEKNKYYLVNLNADPSLNELLVYYLKEKTFVGGRGTNPPQDIQLSGLGIQPEHCIVTIEEGGLFLEPIDNARSFINGAPVVEKTPLHHGDRILWGNHHFFRVNCPKSSVTAASEPQTPAQTIDYNFAREELMLNELSNDPIQTAIAKIERQHEEDKQVALEKQRQEYERQFQHLRNILSPSTPYSPYVPFDPFRIGKITPCTPTTQMRVEKWAAERDEMFRRSLVELKADIVRANVLVQEANFLAEELEKQTKFSVTLQIPPCNLSPNRRRGAFVSEPAILVKRKGLGSQVWSMEKLENKLVDMREMYNECKDRNCPLITTIENPAKINDPFYETQENHNLIGVANVFLEVLFHDVTLNYHTPIISQQGEVAGRLQVELSRVSGTFPQDRVCEAASESSSDSNPDEEIPSHTQVTVRVSIKQASGLPLSLSNFVFCQYSFWNHPDTIAVPPIVNPENHISTHRDSVTFRFDHTRDFEIPITEEFIEHCSEGALSIEVWGHRSAGFTRSIPGWEVEQQLAKARSLADRWSELTRKIELWVEVQELTDAGEYAAVEVTSRRDVLTGGVYQLRQGQQRRIQVRVKPVQQSGTLPIICQAIGSIAVGSVCVRSQLQKPLDSYQEEDLALLREKWSDALMRRRQYLDQQIQRLFNKQDKTAQDSEREQSLVDQWVSLTEERNAGLVPTSGSGIPGAPADWDPPPGMEPNIPALFLDLNADDLSSHGNQWQNDMEELPVTGLNSILPKEHGNKFYNLPIIRHCEKDVSAVAAWDSSVHDTVHLNKATDSNERVYLILKTTVRLSHPAPRELVLRKRLSLNIYKRQSLTDRIRRKIVRTDCFTSTGVTYEVVSNIPKASEELEDRESLAQIAASGEETSLSDGETYIEKYTRGVSAVESILTLDRLRQSVAVKELLQGQGQTLMRKTASVPNFSQLMRCDSSLESLSLSPGVPRSESVSDLKNEHHHESRTLRKPTESELSQSSPKPFGIASPNTKLGLRMTTLHEEHSLSMRLGASPAVQEVVEEDEEEEEEEEEEEVDEVQEEEKKKTSSKQVDEIQPAKKEESIKHVPAEKKNEQPQTVLQRPSKMEFTEFESHEVDASKSNQIVRSVIPNSRTLDSLAEFQAPKTGTPSTSSSGYGSQAVSSSNLTNEDALSLRSMSVDETPDAECRLPQAEQQLRPVKETEPPSENTDSSQSNTDSVASTVIVDETLPLQQSDDAEVDKSQPVTHHSADDESTSDGTSVAPAGLAPGKVVRRRKTNRANSGGGGGGGGGSQSRASFPMARQQVSESKAAMRLEQRIVDMSASMNGEGSSDEKNHTEDEGESAQRVEEPIPDWVCLGESVLIRPSNASGVVAFVGPTEFAAGTWIGVDLDAPTGKNDGVVKGVRYFEARPKHGIFVRVNKLILDKRGRAMRSHGQESSMRRSSSKSEGLSTLHRSRSRGEGLGVIGTLRHSSLRLNK